MQRVCIEVFPQFIKVHFINDNMIREFCLEENVVFQIDKYSIQVENKSGKNIKGSISFYKDSDNNDVLRVVSDNCSLSVKSNIDLFLDYASVFIKKS
ncbi:MAG: hypothetical protein JHC31_11360 [Sulfurihydrogenibium sp.]|jgi:hypothetical protein|nr:hypothetical protein [Sulfurihydrogenibium sp.]